MPAGRLATTGADTIIGCVVTVTFVNVAVFKARNLADRQWHHLMGVRNGAQIHLYVDGARVATDGLSANYNLSTVSSKIAKHGGENRHAGRIHGD